MKQLLSFLDAHPAMREYAGTPIVAGPHRVRLRR
jgi:hypothetical protein